jgi:Mn2+/Fe2+ NRAMP family transporter
MGQLVNRRLTTVTTSVIAALIITMNVYLLKLTFG